MKARFHVYAPRQMVYKGKLYQATELVYLDVTNVNTIDEGKADFRRLWKKYKGMKRICEIIDDSWNKVFYFSN